MDEINSEISGFYRLSLVDRQKLIAELCSLDADEENLLIGSNAVSELILDTMVENVIGAFTLPLGIATNFKINGKDYLIPMVTEESSVIAAASNGAKIARKHGGFFADPIQPIMIGQIQLAHFEDTEKVRTFITEKKENLLQIANDADPQLVLHGGGAIDIEIREFESDRGKMIVLHLLVNVQDAMGANSVNTMVETLGKVLEQQFPTIVKIKIISNLAIHRIAKCQAIFDADLLGGSSVVENILDAYTLATIDPFRAATHNKGIMNGVSAVVMATGNDSRAIEAGAHAYAASQGIYRPLSRFELDENGNLKGSIELPMALGVIGGLTRSHPQVRLNLKILNIATANELSQIAAAVGLAQNLAALRALASEGIQQGHMKLHARKHVES